MQQDIRNLQRLYIEKYRNCCKYPKGSGLQDSRAAAGGVITGGQYATLSPHGWCKLRMGNTWRIVDCSIQRAYGTKLYLVTRKTYPYRLRCDKTYPLKVSSGKVKKMLSDSFLHLSDSIFFCISSDQLSMAMDLPVIPIQYCWPLWELPDI